MNAIRFLLVCLVVTSVSAQTKLVKTVDSTAALLALNPNDVHNVAITSYDTVSGTADDGSVYRYYPLSAVATNGTTVLKPTSFNGRWIRINGPGTGSGVGTNGTPSFINGTNTVTGINVTNTATIEWANLAISNAAPSVVLNSIGGAQIAVDLTLEAEIEAVVDLADLQGAVTDAQVPNSITIDNATLAATASAGDSATAFFAIGTLENARLDSDLTALGDNTGLGLWAITAIGSGTARTITNGVGILVDVGGGVTGNPSVRHNIEAGSNIILSTNSGALVITASSGATGDNISFNATNTADANFTNSSTISWIHNSATTPDDITANIIASSITAAMIANGDHGDFTYAANVATIDANAVALTTDTTGNYVADVAGTANEITSTHTPAEGSTATISLPATIDLGGKTSFEIPNAAAPTVDAFGEIAGDNNLWAASRGAPVFFDGTAAVALVGALVSDAPSNGQVPTWNTGGTITWESVAGSGDITGVGDVTSGDAFTGTQGTTLTFNDSGGDHTFLFNTTLDQFELSTNLVGAHFTSTNGFTSLGAGTGTITIGNAGVVMVDDGDGALVITGAGNGSDEDFNLNLDDTDNNWVFSSSMGVTNAGFTAIGLTAISFTGPLVGNADTSTAASTVVVIDGTDTTSSFLIADSATGTLPVKTDAGATYNAGTGAASFTSLTEGANAVPNATDHLGFFAATTGAQLAGNISNETGTGVPVFSSDMLITNLTVFGVTNWTTVILRAPVGSAPGLKFMTGVTAADARSWGVGINKTANGDFVIRESSTNTTDPFSTGTDRLIILSGGAATFSSTLTATTFIGAGGGLTLNASGFNGNLTTSDDTLQEVAQKLDDLTGTNAQFVNGTNTTAINITDTATITWTRTAATNALASVITVPVVDSTDATSFIAMFDSATGNLAPKTDGGLLYSSATGTLDVSSLTEAGSNVPNAGDDLSFFSATTSSQLRGVMSDEVGAGPVMFTRVGVLRTIWIDAGAMTSSSTNGAAFITNTVAGADNYTGDVYAFDDTTSESTQAKISMPDEWDRGTIKVKFYWTTLTGTGDVAWKIAAGAASNDDPLGAILGTEIEVDDTRLADNDVHVTAATAAITVGGTPALDDFIIFKVRRDPSDGGDTKTGDALLLGIKVQYLESTTEPSAW